ncbi:putative late blight resistance protein homolog R1C-3 [Solanum dulcamara]|uniref:putative late blight resistance protein homolog R1C-3 n=1 Tax=Solanum dulcamara TaxID=45834 RepID=UPI002485E945|nr:putative late blight resistance protein homolog R1C-3 [Solanum dulcamara]
MEVVCEKETVSSARPSTKRSFPLLEEEVVGFEKDAESIMERLIGGIKELDVISIFGMAGLGKTTLARKVYNNPSIINRFDVKVWCTVFQAYNRKKLLAEIFKQATRREINEDDDIADMLRKSLIGRRYLIVLDDIWEVKAFEDLGICFPQGENGSRVIVTTRIEQVAKHLQHCSDPYSLRFLTPEESWELLQKKVFRGEFCPPDLLEVGLQIVKICKGLPLVIVVIAGILGKKEREASFWHEVANDLSSLALGEQSMKVIQSSYDHLENHLKPCLLYMGLFPEDHKIPVSDLLKLWMAEEFVLNAETENMEEASRVCLNDLLNRSLVIVSERKIDGDIESCILHDVVREFCLRKLTEEKFMQLAMPYNPYQHLQYSKDSRLCIYIHDDLVKQLDDSEYQLDKIPMLNSKETNSLEFIAHPKFNTWNNWSNPLHLLVKLRFVRVLHLLDVELPNSWATAMKSLTQLRYLALYVEQFEFKWISHLHDLQTLQLRSRKKLHLKAATLWEMTKLRHVNIGRFSFVWEDNDQGILEESSPTMLENLKTFHTCCIPLNNMNPMFPGMFLNSIPLTNMNPRFWWRFPNLEKLSLRVKYVPEYPLFPIPEVHTRLHSLSLVLSLTEFWDSVGWESYFVFPSNLRRLCLVGCFLTEEMVSNIARLRKLESLRLEGGFPLGESGHCWDVRNVEFPALKYLSLDIVPMEEWNASEASFPLLEKLVVKYCRYFKEIPPSFVDIPTLQLIELVNCRDSLGVSAMNIKKEIEETTGCNSLQVLIS